MPHPGHLLHLACAGCGPSLPLLRAWSDLLIGVAFISIGLALWRFTRRRASVPFGRRVRIFATALAACGVSDVLLSFDPWHPVPALVATFFRALAGALALVGVAALLPVISKALAFRSPLEIEQMDAELREALRIQSETLEGYGRERQVGAALQRALLPQGFPSVPGLEIRTAYRAASQGVEVGGDWFDAFSLSERLVAVSCGDVAGHGLRATVLMGTVRQMVRVVAREDDDPAVVLGRVNRLLCSEEDTPLVTAFYGVLDLLTGVLRYAAAGHPDPLVVAPGGQARTLHADGIVLGVDPDAAFAWGRTTLAEGSLLVVYTDGLVGAGRDLLRATEDLFAVAILEAERSSPNVAEAIGDAMFATAAPLDDAAVLTLRIGALGAEADRNRRSWRVDASDGRRSQLLRAAVMNFLGEYGSPQSDFGSAELIVGELLGNVARHTASGAASVQVEWRDGAASMTVQDDDGAPFSAPVPGRALEDLMSETGRGLALVSLLGRDFRIERTRTGNLVAVTLPVVQA